MTKYKVIIREEESRSRSINHLDFRHEVDSQAVERQRWWKPFAHSGDCFGAMSLLKGERRTATVRADGDCYVLEIGKPVLGEIIRQSPDCLNQLSDLLAQCKLETEGIIKGVTEAQSTSAKEREYSAFLRRLRTFFEL
jgi:CRP-like cAMP-binding protein